METDAVARTGVQRYELEGVNRWIPLVIFPFFGLVAFGCLVAAVRDQRWAALGFLALWCVATASMAWYVLFVIPTTIDADDRGLRFIGRRSTKALPWSELKSITAKRSWNGPSLEWRWDGGKAFTLAGHRGLHRLLTEIETEHPHVVVDV